MTLNLKRVRYFTVVADELHFGRAADRLHMAQPPLSQQIRQLEQDLGVELFNRSTRKVSLTEAGSIFLPDALQLLAEADGVERRLAELGSASSGQLRIGFVDSTSYEIMPRFLGTYQSRWPTVAYELRSMSSDEQHQALTRSEIDIGFGRANRDPSLIKQQVILNEPLVVAVPENHPLASQSTTTLSRLAGERFLGFDQATSPTLHSELAAMCGAQNVAYDPVIQATEYTTIVGLVASGQGIAIVPSSVQTFRPPNITYLSLRDRRATSSLLLLSRQSERSELVQNARQLLEELFSGQKP